MWSNYFSLLALFCKSIEKSRRKEQTIGKRWIRTEKRAFAIAHLLLANDNREG